MSAPRTALLLSGHVRSLPRTLPGLRRVVDACGCDVFAHTWSEAQMRAATWRAPDGAAHDAVPVHEQVGALAPRRLIVEHADDALLDAWSRTRRGVPWHGPRRGCHFMLYGMSRALDALDEHERATGQRYDTVIRYRFDLDCPDPAALARDLARVRAGEADVLLARHNWASAFGARFDGVVLARAQAYRAFVAALPGSFLEESERIGAGETLMPELLISRLLEGDGRRCGLLQASFGLVRTDGRTEQVFGPALPGMLAALRPHVGAWLAMRQRPADAATGSYLDRCWREHAGPMLRGAVSRGLGPIAVIAQRLGWLR